MSRVVIYVGISKMFLWDTLLFGFMHTEDRDFFSYYLFYYVAIALHVKHWSFSHANWIKRCLLLLCPRGGVLWMLCYCNWSLSCFAKVAGCLFICMIWQGCVQMCAPSWYLLVVWPADLAPPTVTSSHASSALARLPLGTASLCERLIVAQAVSWVWMAPCASPLSDRKKLEICPSCLSEVERCIF